MRIRTIKPEFFLHEGLFEAEKATKLPLRLAFAGLWCAADREGRFKWEPRRLGVQVLPYDGVDFSRVLDALATRGFIVKYASATGEFGVIPTFKAHQVVNNRERESELPPPPDSLELQGFDACPTRASRDDDGNAELKSGREGKGREQGKEGSGDDSLDEKPKENKARCTLEEAKAFAKELGLPESDGESCFHKWEGNGWKNGTNSIKDWKATIRSWKSAGFLPSQKQPKFQQQKRTPTSCL